MSKRALVMIGVPAVLTVVAPLTPAKTASCPIEFWDCWNPSSHPSCTGSDSTVKTKTTPIGTLELRYRSAAPGRRSPGGAACRATPLTDGPMVPRGVPHD